MSKAVEIIDGVLFVHTRHYDDVNRVIICHQKKPYRVFSDDEKKVKRMNRERAIQILKMNEQEKWRSGITSEEEKEAFNMAIEALKERENMIGWLSKFCLHIDMADKHLSDREAKVFWKKKMNEQFGWEEGEAE